MRHPFRRKNLSVRLLPWYAVAIAGFWLAEPRPPAFAVGALLTGAGAALRVWGAGHLVKNDALVVSGPYARLRHPLYAGTLLLALGFGAMAGLWAAAVVCGLFVPTFFLYYLPYKERIESARLERRYGDPYAAYRAAVPALVPARRRWSPVGRAMPGASVGWRLGRVRENGELGTLLGVAVATLLLALRPLLPL